LFSAPFPITKQWASISKDAIVVKKAPKDTIEAALMAKEKLDTTIHQQVNIELTVAEVCKIYIRENSEQINNTRFSFNEKWQQHLTNVKQLSGFKLPEYFPSIILYINKKDAVSIYRGFPRKAMVVIKI